MKSVLSSGAKRRWNRWAGGLGVGLAVTLLTLGLGGCGQKAAESIAEKAIEFAASADGKSVDIDFDSDSGTMTIKTEEGTVTMTTGENTSIPDDFPADVPVYPGFEPQMATSIGDGMFSLSGTVGDSLAKVKAYCEKEVPAQGWTQTTSMDQDAMFMRVYEKDGRSLSLTGMDQGGETMLSINVGKK